jgi:sacsin
MSGMGSLRAYWNECLLHDVIAPAYAVVLSKAAQLLGNTAAYHQLWPCAQLQQPWQIVVDHLVQGLQQLPVLWTPAAAGFWLSPEDALLPDDKCLADPQLAAAVAKLGMLMVDMPAAVCKLIKQQMVSSPPPHPPPPHPHPPPHPTSHPPGP